jgi:CO/xanthine dehydrogenase FAD-binding subunit
MAESTQRPGWRQSRGQFYFPTSLAELFSTWQHFPDAKLCAGGAQLFYGQTGRSLNTPETIISLAKIDELKKVSRTERYIEIGAMVPLSEIITLGKVVPAALRSAILRIANPQVRNLATLGGNICYAGYRLDTVCPLAVLDAAYELKTALGARSVSALRFNSPQGLALGSQEILTSVRIPLEGWDFVALEKFNSRSYGDSGSGLIAFIARIQKNILSEVRIAFCGRYLLMDKNIESTLSGRELPLAARDIHRFAAAWEDYITGLQYPEGMLRTRVLNFIVSTLESLIPGES